MEWECPRSGGAVLCVVGARPNFMKIAPIMRAMNSSGMSARLVHTGQHYDPEMNRRFFDALGIPDPDINLEVGSGTHALQTAEIMRRFEPVVDQQRPAAVLVVGDVNSSLACALVAVKKRVPVIHVEAGLRSYDRTMPEEINRVLTDQISDVLFTSEKSARDNLMREGISDVGIHFVGNVMIDTLRQNVNRAVAPVQTLTRHGVPSNRAEKGYALLTMHRPSNVDEPRTLRMLLDAVGEVGRRIPVIFPMHPRTRAKIEQHALQPMLEGGGLVVLPPLGYLEMLGLMSAARFVLTDSGGIQEETTALGVPCMTLRDNTERPVTVNEGTNTVVGRDPARIISTAQDILRTGGKAGRIPALWDGRASERIAGVLAEWLTHTGQRCVA